MQISGVQNCINSQHPQKKTSFGAKLVLGGKETSVVNPGLMRLYSPTPAETETNLKAWFGKEDFEKTKTLIANAPKGLLVAIGAAYGEAFIKIRKASWTYHLETFPHEIKASFMHNASSKISLQRLVRETLRCHTKVRHYDRYSITDKKANNLLRIFDDSY
jgi:hypothetical protein